jgi:hypothetical protein
MHCQQDIRWLRLPLLRRQTTLAMAQPALCPFCQGYAAALTWPHSHCQGLQDLR